MYLMRINDNANTRILFTYAHNQFSISLFLYIVCYTIQNLDQVAIIPRTLFFIRTSLETARPSLKIIWRSLDKIIIMDIRQEKIRGKLYFLAYFLWF